LRSKVLEMEGEQSLPSPTPSQSRGLSRRLTFTKTPVVPRAKPQQRSDFTHSPNQLRKIGHENSILVDKIAKISARGKESPKMVEPTSPDKLKVASVSSAAVNRKKTYDKIAEENLKMYNRLQQIKPSAEIQRKNLDAAHKQNIEYRRNCSIIRRDTSKKNKMEDREAGWQD